MSLGLVFLGGEGVKRVLGMHADQYRRSANEYLGERDRERERELIAQGTISQMR